MKKIIFSIAFVIGILGFIGHSNETQQAQSFNTPTIHLVDPGTH